MFSGPATYLQILKYIILVTWITWWKSCEMRSGLISGFLMATLFFYKHQVNSAQPQICLNVNNRPYCYKTIDLLFYSQYPSLNMLIAFIYAYIKKVYMVCWFSLLCPNKCDKNFPQLLSIKSCSFDFGKNIYGSGIYQSIILRYENSHYKLTNHVLPDS